MIANRSDASASQSWVVRKLTQPQVQVVASALEEKQKEQRLQRLDEEKRKARQQLSEFKHLEARWQAALEKELSRNAPIFELLEEQKEQEQKTSLHPLLTTPDDTESAVKYLTMLAQDDRLLNLQDLIEKPHLHLHPILHPWFYFLLLLKTHEEAMLDERSPYFSFYAEIKDFDFIEQLRDGFYEAKHKNTDERLFVKFFHDGILNEAARHASTLFALKSPHIIQPKHIGWKTTMVYKRKTDYCFIAMEYIQFSLEELFKQPKLPWNLILQLLFDVISGIVDAHQAGIAILNIHPQTIFVNAQYHAKIGDFSVSRKRHQEDRPGIETRLTHSHFSAPELLMKNFKTLASDLYSFGYLAKALILWKPNCTMEDDPRQVKDCPSKLSDCVFACLDQDPRKRPTALDVQALIYQLRFNPIQPVLHTPQNRLSNISFAKEEALEQCLINLGGEELTFTRDEAQALRKWYGDKLPQWFSDTAQRCFIRRPGNPCDLFILAFPSEKTLDLPLPQRAIKPFCNIFTVPGLHCEKNPLGFYVLKIPISFFLAGSKTLHLAFQQIEMHCQSRQKIYSFFYKKQPMPLELIKLIREYHHSCTGEENECVIPHTRDTGPSEEEKSRASQPLDARLLRKMPSDVFKTVLAPQLEVKEATTLATVSIKLASLFRNEHLRQEMLNNEKNRRVFQHLVRGEQDEVRAILEKAKAQGPDELRRQLTSKYTITDHANRQFRKITLFQLALWYLDSHMWCMLLSYFQDPTVADDLYGVAYKQYQEHQTHQTPYAQEQGEYYLFEGKAPGQKGLVTELQVHADSLASPSFTAWKQWQLGVGSAQTRVPLHVIHEYCRQDGAPLASGRFREKHLPRTTHFFDLKTRRLMSYWEGLDSGLGVSFGLHRGWAPRATALPVAHLAAVLDYAACRCLAQVRMEEYQALEHTLRKELEAAKTYRHP